jgi:hypothetical protein
MKKIKQFINQLPIDKKNDVYASINMKGMQHLLEAHISNISCEFDAIEFIAMYYEAHNIHCDVISTILNELIDVEEAFFNEILNIPGVTFVD